MASVLTLDAILFGILVFSGILGNILVIFMVRGRLYVHVFEYFESLVCWLLCDIYSRGKRAGGVHWRRYRGANTLRITVNELQSVYAFYFDVPSGSLSKSGSESDLHNQTAAVQDSGTVLIFTSGVDHQHH